MTVPNFDAKRNQSLAISGAAAALILGCIWAYWPGLAGPFLFDDFASIADLGDLGGVTDWNSLKAFVFGGHAGPTGRPLALLSFLIDGNNWPTDPWPFKRTNLVIHILCGASLAVLTYKLLLLIQYEPKSAKWCALVASAVWLLHPFLVSTTLYVVQRMAQLATLFIFLGLITYLHGRTRLTHDKWRGYAIMSIAIASFTILSMLSKENGILLPVLVGVLEITLIASQRSRFPALNRYWAAVFILLPTIVIVTYLGERLFREDFLNTAASRDFSIYERLLTQFRILADYLQHWFIPELYTTGVFQDHFIKSTAWLSPLSTLITALAHGIAIALAVTLRRKKPLIAFAVLFFYGSHLLESTVLNLELYFEHRNYLASAFLVLPIVTWIQRAGSAPVFVLVWILLLSVLFGITRYTATVWSDYESIVEASASKAPTSARAQQQHAASLFNGQRYDEALAVLNRAIETMPDETSLRVSRAMIQCKVGALSDEGFDQMSVFVATRPYSGRQYDLYMTFVSIVEESQCVSNVASRLEKLFSGLLEIPENSDPTAISYSQIQFFIGYSNVLDNDPIRAVKAFEKSLRSRPGSGHAMLMAAMLASHGHLDAALAMSHLAMQQLGYTNSDALRGTRVSRDDILEFQNNVKAEMNAAP